MLKWFRCFLTTSRHRFALNGSFSSWLPVISGLPQESSLGPLLFSVYLNDLVTFVRCKLRFFADDVSLYHQIVSHKDCLYLQNNLNTFLHWCQKWQMQLQFSKCEALCISNERTSLMFIFVTISHFDGVIRLRVHINQHLTWSDHC